MKREGKEKKQALWCILQGHTTLEPDGVTDEAQLSPRSF